MMDMLNKIMKFIGLDNTTKSRFNSFIVGNVSYLVIEFIDDKSIIFSKIIHTLVNNNIDFYWFRSYNEFENNMDYLEFNEDRYIFIVIG